MAKTIKNYSNPQCNRSSAETQGNAAWPLGLRRIGHTVEREDTPAIRGMINAVSFMVKVEE